MTGLMKTVLRHRRQASINTKLGQRRPASTKRNWIITHYCNMHRECIFKVDSDLEEVMVWSDSPTVTWCCSLYPWQGCLELQSTQFVIPNWRCSVEAGRVTWKQYKKQNNKTKMHKITITSKASRFVNIIVINYLHYHWKFYKSDKSKRSIE